MSALDDINRVLKRLPPVKEGWERAILVGINARQSIATDIALDRASPGLHEQIAGIAVLNTREFDGWEIRDCDPDGCWHDVPLLKVAI